MNFNKEHKTTLPTDLINILIEGFEPRNLDADQQQGFRDLVLSLTAPDHQAVDAYIFECLEDAADDIRELQQPHPFNDYFRTATEQSWADA